MAIIYVSNFRLFGAIQFDFSDKKIFKYTEMDSFLYMNKSLFFQSKIIPFRMLVYDN